MRIKLNQGVALSILITVLTSCMTLNVLTLKHRKNYKEYNLIKNDSTNTLVQRVTYSRPNVSHGEFSSLLTFKFINTNKALQKRQLNLQEDSLIVKCKYEIGATDDWEKENNILTGNIEIIDWTTDKITIKENIRINDISRKQTLKYIGKRTFTKGSNP